ncbi:MAG: hypothetical protein ACI9JU_002514 [Pseudohongiellaceae bacterium]|jgi:hypothetical protein
MPTCVNPSTTTLKTMLGTFLLHYRDLFIGIPIEYPSLLRID